MNCFFPTGRACGIKKEKAPGNLGFKKNKNSIPAGCQARCWLLVSSLSTIHAARVRAALFVTKRKGQGIVFYTLHCESVNGSAVHNARGFLLHIPLEQPLQTASLTLAGEEDACALWWALAQPFAAQPGLCTGTGAVFNLRKWAAPSHGQDTFHRHAHGCSTSEYPSGYYSEDVCVSHNSSMLQSGEGRILP